MKHYRRLSLRDHERICAGVWGDVKRYPCRYSAVRAHERAHAHARHGRKRKLDVNPVLKSYVYEKLRMEWSPEEIANRLKLDYPEDMTMRVSHETIYRHLYCLPKGELKRELMRGLRREQKRRLSRSARYYRRQRIQDMISISERPKEARDRIVPGHWEGDLIIGKNRASALGSPVERAPRA